MERVTGISDDVLVSGKTKKEHLRSLRSSFEQARKHGQRYSLEKFRFNVPEVRYYGDPKKVVAIINMAVPTCKAELQTILGMANYLPKFAPNLSDIAAPMRDHLKKDTEFLWNSQQEIAFNKTKEVITKVPVLAFYDPKKEHRDSRT